MSLAFLFFCCFWGVPVIHKILCDRNYATVQTEIAQQHFDDTKTTSIAILESPRNKRYFKWKHNGKEFEYNGRMYDVVNFRNVNNGRIYNCICDSVENKLNSIVENWSKSLGNHASHAPIAIRFLMLCFSFCDHISPNIQLLNFNKQEHTHVPYLDNLYSSYFMEMLQPPKSVIEV